MPYHKSPVPHRTGPLCVPAYPRPRRISARRTVAKAVGGWDDVVYRFPALGTTDPCPSDAARVGDRHTPPAVARRLAAPACASRHALNTMAKFCQSYHAKKDPILVYRCQPRQDACIGARLVFSDITLVSSAAVLDDRGQADACKHRSGDCHHHVAAPSAARLTLSRLRSDVPYRLRTKRRSPRCPSPKIRPGSTSARTQPVAK